MRQACIDWCVDSVIDGWLAMAQQSSREWTGPRWVASNGTVDVYANAGNWGNHRLFDWAVVFIGGKMVAIGIIPLKGIRHRDSESGRKDGF